MLRRTRAGAERAGPALSWPTWSSTRTATRCGGPGARSPLSPTEFNLLRYLMVNAGRVLSKAQILDHVWSYDFDGDANIVESYISYLRRKLDDGEPAHPHRAGRRLRAPAAP